MVRTKDEVLKIVQDYVEFIEEIFYVKKAYVFGSYINGRPNEWSDIDVAIVSPDFAHMSRHLAMKLLGKMSRRFDDSIEAIAFTEKDVTSPIIGTLAREVLNTGLELSVRD